MTRREVLIARDAVELGVANACLTLRSFQTILDAEYPLPVVTRPRVVAVGSHEFCLNNGMAHVRPVGNSIWTVYATRDELAALRSLDAEPTETVTEEEP